MNANTNFQLAFVLLLVVVYGKNGEATESQLLRLAEHQGKNQNIYKFKLLALK